jgi:predicted nucleic acid-binding protein
MSVVVDAGVAIKWMIVEPYTAEARALRDDCLRRRISMIVPMLFGYEIASVLRRLEIAASTVQESAYDTQYLALAEREGAEFWTADEPFFKAAQGQFSQMKWIGAHPLPPPPKTST